MTIVVDSSSFPNAWAYAVKRLMDYGTNQPADDERGVMIRNDDCVINMDFQAITDIAKHRLHPSYPQQHGLDEYIAQFDPASPQAHKSILEQPYTYLSRTWKQMKFIRENHLLMKQFNKRIRATTWRPFEDLGENNPPCFDDKTEILTYEGWKPIKHISYYDNIATLNHETGGVEYHTPYNVIHKIYDGQMCTQQTRTINYVVTPNHMMYVAKQESNIFEFIKAQDLLHKMHISTKCYSSGNNVNTIKIGDKTHELKVFAKFLAIYLADGSYLQNGKRYKYRINITQKCNKDEYIKIVNALGYNYYISNDSNSDGCIHISISNKNLWTYVSQFGKSREKYIPDIIKRAGSEIICEFLQAYRFGDYNTSCGSGRYGTTSKRLADDLQEIIILSGLQYRPSMYIRKDIEYYEIIEREYKYGAEINKPTYVDYNGMIHCVEVPNNIIMVRRNGKPMWCGNCLQSLSFRNIGDNRAHLFTHWRSHDAYGAWQWNNIALYEYVNKEVLEPEGLRLVKWTEYNESLHVYDYDWTMARKVLPLPEVALHTIYR